MASRAERIGAQRGAGYRANVAVRVGAGTIGAYAVAALAAFAGARLWPADGFDAVFPPTLIAFLVMPAATLWAFLARGPWRAWAGLLLAAGLLALAAWAAGAPA